MEANFLAGGTQSRSTRCASQEYGPRNQSQLVYWLEPNSHSATARDSQTRLLLYLTVLRDDIPLDLYGDSGSPIRPYSLSV